MREGEERRGSERRERRKMRERWGGSKKEGRKKMEKRRGRREIWDGRDEKREVEWGRGEREGNRERGRGGKRKMNTVL